MEEFIFVTVTTPVRFKKGQRDCTHKVKTFRGYKTRYDLVCNIAENIVHSLLTHLQCPIKQHLLMTGSIYNPPLDIVLWGLAHLRKCP
jgi:hypothetical protein